MKNAERDESKAAKTGRRRRRRPAWKSRSGPRLIATHEAGPWSMIVFVLLLNVLSSTWIGEKGRRRESSSNRTIPGGSLLNHDCQWRNPRPSQAEERGGGGGGGGREANRDGNSWNVVLLYFFARVSLPPLFLVQTIPYFRTRGNFNQGAESMRLSWEAYAVFVLTIRSARSCFQRERRDTARIHQARRAGCDSPSLPFPSPPGYRIIHRLGCRRRRDLKCWYQPRFQPFFFDVLPSSSTPDWIDFDWAFCQAESLRGVSVCERFEFRIKRSRWNENSRSWILRNWYSWMFVDIE